VRDRGSRDERVVGSRLVLAPGAAKGRRNSAEGAGTRRVEGDWVEVGLGLLQMRLPRSPLPRVARHERADRQLGQRDRADQTLRRQILGIELSQVDHRGRIE
jgi:hypothetical protein